MATAERGIKPLVAGERLKRDEFLRRWEAMPELKKAELIGGIVYVPSPVSAAHAEMHVQLTYWLMTYALDTRGLVVTDNVTWHVDDQNLPQPDVSMRLPPQLAHSQIVGPEAHGAPELAAEVCLSSTSYDLHQKKDLYRQAGVDEYVAILLREREVRWHRLEAGDYHLLQPDAQGILRSVVFPGLLLDPAALVAGDMTRVLDVLRQGLASAEHADFLARLSARQT